MERVDGVRSARLVNHDHDPGMQSDEISLRDPQLPSIGETKDKRVETIAQALADLVHNHASAYNLRVKGQDSLRRGATG